MTNDLALLSGIDIPFPQAQMNIHQPTLKEISYIGEESFFLGCELLNFSKDILSEEDKISSANKSNFEILMSILNDKNSKLAKSKVSVLFILTLIFPDYKISFNSDAIVFSKEDKECKINNLNFEQFKEIIVKIFCLKRNKGESIDYNPGNETARKMTERFKKRHEKIAKQNGEDKKKISVLSKYVSILAVGERKNLDALMNYTVYQLYDEFERFQLKESYDIYLKAKMAGAQDLEEVDHWMKDIHS